MTAIRKVSQVQWLYSPLISFFLKSKTFIKVHSPTLQVTIKFPTMRKRSTSLCLNSWQIFSISFYSLLMPILTHLSLSPLNFFCLTRTTYCLLPTLILSLNLTQTRLLSEPKICKVQSMTF